MPEAPPLLIVGTKSDDPFAIDVGVYCQQNADISDLISLKTFANSEFCPRFINDEHDFRDIGNKLQGASVVIVSTVSNGVTRNELAWRNLLVARAARDNGAQSIVLVEPDLFFSAQDRGPRPGQGETDFERDLRDYKKFDGQPFSSLLYAQALSLAGVDSVITVHNHSASVQRLFGEVMQGHFLNLNPAEVYADYIQTSDVTPNFHESGGLLVCAPDKGARNLARSVQTELDLPEENLLFMAKERFGERNVLSMVDPQSPCSADGITGRDVMVMDDMVRTGSTIMECCRLLKQAGASRVVFFVTHFYSSPEVRENLSTHALDEIITTNTLPGILNRDMQGRLRRKMTVLKLEKWISHHLLMFLGCSRTGLGGHLYKADMSSKNPRSREETDTTFFGREWQKAREGDVATTAGE